MKPLQYFIEGWNSFEDIPNPKGRDLTYDYNLQCILEEIAEEYWDQDVCDPDNFECIIHLSDGRKFTVCAEYSVDFYAEEIKE